MVKKALNLWIDETEHQVAEKMAKDNKMSISGLVRLLIAKAADNPKDFGLRVELKAERTRKPTTGQEQER